MIRFLGIGSAFNTQLGNNSGFVKNGASMILIDCGGTVFERLRKFKVLERLKKVYIIVTHTHPDHIGSLGDLIFYCHYKLKIKPTIYFPENTLMQNLFSVIGVKEDMYTLIKSMKNNLNDDDLGEIVIEFVQSSHTKSIPAFGFFLTIDKKSVYYSGDGNRIPKTIIELLKKGEIESIYQDTTSIDYVDTGHLSFTKLCEIIDESLRNKVYCMHLDENIEKKNIIDAGFKIAPLMEE